MSIDIFTARSGNRTVVGAALVILPALLAGGCSSSVNQQKNTAGADRMRTAATRDGLDGHARKSASVSGGGQGRCETATVYFAYDSSDLDAEARRILQENAACVQKSKAGGVTIVGMTDPRGTEEYNLALGDRRARSTAKYLSSLDTSQKPVTVRSVGEEFATGNDEGSWARERRVEIELR